MVADGAACAARSLHFQPELCAERLHSKNPVDDLVNGVRNAVKR